MFASYDKTKSRTIGLPEFEKLFARLETDEILLGKVPIETLPEAKEIFEKLKNENDQLTRPNFEALCKIL